MSKFDSVRDLLVDASGIVEMPISELSAIVPGGLPNAVEIDAQIRIGTPKTHDQRSVPFLPMLVPLLKAACKDKLPSALVFSSPDGGFSEGPVRMSGAVVGLLEQSNAPDVPRAGPVVRCAARGHQFWWLAVTISPALVGRTNFAAQRGGKDACLRRPRLNSRSRR